jgi:hypothetical protein
MGRFGDKSGSVNRSSSVVRYDVMVDLRVGFEIVGDKSGRGDGCGAILWTDFAHLIGRCTKYFTKNSCSQIKFIVY